jgi:FKBP-type peptidyl-prolyl cis-trans isomerase FklB
VGGSGSFEARATTSGGGGAMGREDTDMERWVVNSPRDRARLLASLVVLTIAGCKPSGSESAAQAASVDLDSETGRINYSVGYQIGGDFKRQGVELDAAAIVRGIEDALSGGEPLLAQPEMQETLIQLKRKIVAEERERSNRSELVNIAEGEAFLAANAEKEGVVQTQSGLQYRILEAGNDRRPGVSDEVTCRYRGTLVSGNVFDATDEEPASFRLDRVIPGWTEGLQLIGEGGRIELFIPPQLAYRGNGPLAHRTLIFEIELISVQPSS